MTLKAVRLSFSLQYSPIGQIHQRRRYLKARVHYAPPLPQAVFLDVRPTSNVKIGLEDIGFLLTGQRTRLVPSHLTDGSL